MRVWLLQSVFGEFFEFGFTNEVDRKMFRTEFRGDSMIHGWPSVHI